MLRVLMIIFITAGSILPVYPQSPPTEVFRLDLRQPDSYTIEDNRVLKLSSANASIELEGMEVEMYRWIISAQDTTRITVALENAQWSPVPGATIIVPKKPRLAIHSAQTWGTIRVVLVDLYPWRNRDGTVSAAPSVGGRRPSAMTSARSERQATRLRAAGRHRTDTGARLEPGVRLTYCAMVPPRGFEPRTY